MDEVCREPHLGRLCGYRVTFPVLVSRLSCALGAIEYVWMTVGVVSWGVVWLVACSGRSLKVAVSKAEDRGSFQDAGRIYVGRMVCPATSPPAPVDGSVGDDMKTLGYG